MVDFEGRYYFPADSVINVEIGTTCDSDYPYVITVYLKGDKSVGIKYKTQKARDEGKQVLLARIDFEQRRDVEDIQSRLWRIEDFVKRTDKRQLRIWRQLQRLIGADPEEKEKP